MSMPRASFTTSTAADGGLPVSGRYRSPTTPSEPRKTSAGRAQAGGAAIGAADTAQAVTTVQSRFRPAWVIAGPPSEPGDQGEARRHEHAAEDTAPARRVDLEAEPPDMVEQHRAEQLAGDHQRHQGRRAEAARQQDGRDAVDGPGEATQPRPPWRPGSLGERWPGHPGDERVGEDGPEPKDIVHQQRGH